MSYDVRLPFGKWRGRLLNDVPLSYLKWMLSECNAAEPWLVAAVRAEVSARGERFLDAAAVLADLEEALTEAVSDDDELPHWVASRLTDHALTAFEAVRTRHGIGSSTELVVPARSERQSACLQKGTWS